MHANVLCLPTSLPPVTSASWWSSSWLLSSIRRELPPNLMLKYVNKTMQMSGSTRCGGCGCGSSYRLRILRQLALSMRIPSSSLMCGRAVRAAKSSQASYNNKQPRGVELRTWRRRRSRRQATDRAYYLPCVAWENEQKVEWNKIGRLAGVHIYYLVLEGWQGEEGGKKHSTRAECEQRVRTFWLTSYAM